MRMWQFIENFESLYMIQISTFDRAVILCIVLAKIPLSTG